MRIPSRKCCCGSRRGRRDCGEAQWKNLGMPETLWHCHVKEFGLLIVSIDAYGRNYFEEKKVEYNKKKDEQIEIISKQVGFIK